MLTFDERHLILSMLRTTPDRSLALATATDVPPLRILYIVAVLSRWRRLLMTKERRLAAQKAIPRPSP